MGSIEAKELVGWAPTSLRSWEKMTIKEATVVWLTCRNLAPSKINDKRLGFYFRLFNFFPDDYVGSLSPSRRRMLQTMMAFCTDCKVICLEQPHTSLTVSDQEDLTTILDYLSKGRTILISMEPDSLIEEIAHKVLLLYRGKVLFYDSVYNLKMMLAKYLCVYIHKEGEDLLIEAPLDDIIQTDSLTDINTSVEQEQPLIANLTKIHDNMNIIGYSLMFSENGRQYIPTFWKIFEEKYKNCHIEVTTLLGKYDKNTKRKMTLFKKTVIKIGRMNNLAYRKPFKLLLIFFLLPICMVIRLIPLYKDANKVSSIQSIVYNIDTLKLESSIIPLFCYSNCTNGILNKTAEIAIELLNENGLFFDNPVLEKEIDSNITKNILSLMGGIFMSNRIAAVVLIPNVRTPKYEALNSLIAWEGFLEAVSCFPTLFFCTGLKKLKLKIEVRRQLLLIWLLLPIGAIHSIHLISRRVAYQLIYVLKFISPVALVHNNFAFSSQLIRDILNQSVEWESAILVYREMIISDLFISLYQSAICFIIYLVVIDWAIIKMKLSKLGPARFNSAQLFRRRRWVLKNSAVQLLGVIDQQKYYDSDSVRPFLDTAVKWEKLKIYSKFNWATVKLGNVSINTTPRVDLNLKEGESILIFGVGENSGKYELFETIVGQRRLAGESIVRVFRKSMYDMGFDIFSSIGYLPDSSEGWNMDKLLTTAEALYWTARLRNVKANETDFYLLSLINIFGISNCFHTLLVELPIEQMRLVQIACAIVGLPKIIVLNEPFLGLGLGAKQRVLRILTDLKELNHTIIIGSTSTDEAEQLCDRLIVMYEGTNLITGKIRDVRNTFLPGHHITIRFSTEKYISHIAKLWSYPFEVIRKGKNLIELYADNTIQLSEIYENVQVGIQSFPAVDIYHLVTRPSLSMVIEAAVAILSQNATNQNQEIETIQRR
ncbi:DgyrCDS11232 [Dimorphilus gyrociliatus]|uniref:DgyrCDS11232 n=1 Tax=Dimorphilus gyrociliatus TaxID=2664684 RepID=A0A7I8W2M9_9ANNE|nr:DgyrCDS11232 [Dimorphilus gyrociliatus]